MNSIIRNIKRVRGASKIVLEVLLADIANPLLFAVLACRKNIHSEATKALENLIGQDNGVILSICRSHIHLRLVRI